jgi:imidazolonepropionase-like amidohydrolase
MFITNKIVCLQSDMNMQPLNQNASEQQIMEKTKEITASLALLALTINAAKIMW